MSLVTTAPLTLGYNEHFIENILLLKVCRQDQGIACDKYLKTFLL